eukprot:GHRQ01002074.1.p1 GENE.GHRQ01002074.1~~GHRQ01002074.1.p1  ORF type:complete len:154 (+),score=33.23 GHRQ01002074.1:208-669(+)
MQRCSHTCLHQQRPTQQPCAVRIQQLHSRRWQRCTAVACRAERREYYDFKDMPPLPLTVSRIYIPKLDYTVVEKANEQQRMASLAIFYDIYKDDQYSCKLTRRSAITALCMYDKDDVDQARSSPGQFPNIDLLHRVYNEGLDLQFVVEELGSK